MKARITIDVDVSLERAGENRIKINLPEKKTFLNSPVHVFLQHKTKKNEFVKVV